MSALPPRVRVNVPALVGLVAIIASSLAFWVLIRGINWTVSAEPPRLLSTGEADGLWFASRKIALILEPAGGTAQYYLKSVNVSNGEALSIDSIDLSNEASALGESTSGPAFVRPLFAISRDGQRIAWIEKGLLCASSAKKFNESRCEQAINLPLWQGVQEIAFFGNSPRFVGVVFNSGSFRAFDFERGELNKENPGSKFPQPWRLRSEGSGIAALPEPRTGDFGCFKVEKEKGRDKINAFIPSFNPLVVTAVSFSDCNHVVVGTSTGLVQPISRSEVPGPNDKAYASLDGAVQSLVMSSDGAIYAAGDFSGIFQVGNGTVPRKIADTSRVKLTDAEGEYLLCIATLPMAIELKTDWQPNSWSNFLLNLLVVIAGLFMFIYSIVASRKAV